MNCCLYLTVFLPLIGILVPVEGNDDAPYLALMKQVRMLKSVVKNLSSRIKDAEKTKVVIAERLAGAMKRIEQIKSKQTNHGGKKTFNIIFIIIRVLVFSLEKDV